MTVTPAAANRGACAREVVAPAENSAMSRPVGSAVAASSTTISPPPHGRVVPADRAEAKNRMLADREVPLGQDLAHDAADLTGRADDADAQAALAHRPGPSVDDGLGSSAPRSNASCTARTAMSTSVSRHTTEMRISEVVISSMLTPASASAPKNVADTPGCERMPAPTSDDLADVLVEADRR